MTDKPFDPQAMIDAVAPLLGLSIKEQYRPGIALNLETAARMAKLVETMPLDDEAEPAPVYTP